MRRTGRSFGSRRGRPVLARPLAFLTVVAVAVGAVAAVVAVPVAGARPRPAVRPVPLRPTLADAALSRPAGPAASGGEEGAYEWDDASWWPDPSAYADTLTRLQNLGVTTIYVDITEGVTLLRDHSSALAGFESAFEQLVAEAGADGLGVDAVGGEPAWATSQKKGPAQLLNVVSQIEAGSPTTVLDGVQFDVEPWGLKNWSSHRKADARDWVRFIAATVASWRADGLAGRLGFTVPYWFDGATGGVPRVSVDGSSGYPFQLALGQLAALPETVLNVMAYRNSTSGPNGSLALFASNLEALDGAGSTTTLLAGQETGNVKPAETTFYGLPCSSFVAASNQITDAFDGDAPYQGIAVDDVESLEALCPG